MGLSTLKVPILFNRTAYNDKAQMNNLSSIFLMNNLSSIFPCVAKKVPDLGLVIKGSLYRMSVVNSPSQVHPVIGNYDLSRVHRLGLDLSLRCGRSILGNGCYFPVCALTTQSCFTSTVPPFNCTPTL